MPITSSIIAAERIVVATLPFRWPISLRAGTVILTGVAARIVPINTASSIARSPSPKPNPR